MNAIELATLVQELRNAQKEFFRTRERDILLKAKTLEIQVDEAVEKILNPQKTLF